MLKIMSVFGTRPEAIKMAPVIKELEKHPDCFKSIVCVTAQLRQMLDSVLELFNIMPDYDLDIMKPGQDLFDITSKVLHGFKPVLEKERPDFVLVHGDTTTTMATALAVYYCRFLVGHVEAGLRTHNKYAPFPEEVNRCVTGKLTDIHFSPTEAARSNLLSEGVSESTIHVTGNTVVDALHSVVDLIKSDMSIRCDLELRFSFLNPLKRLILITGHPERKFWGWFLKYLSCYC
jgi:UDP-N-acetylglucosamine 2-epimerase (non-hydrolysing)